MTTEIPAPPAVALRYAAEFVGTFLLVLGVIGAAIFSAAFDSGDGGLNIGILGVSLALGLSVLGGAYAWGPVSGGHFNPAVSLGLAVAGRFDWRLVGGYVVAQVLGGAAASSLIAAVAAGGPDSFLNDALSGGFASTGWGQLSPGGFSLGSAFLVEVTTTAVFVGVILSVTSHRGNPTTAPLAIGLSLTLMALITIPVSNGSFNPARSIATAMYGGQVAVEQLWMSLVAPTLGGVIAGAVAVVISRGHRTASAAPAPPHLVHAEIASVR
ncbi:aquaporin [Microbacterium sp. P06]|uniref:aquaporin n=1 Tax=Microbacterium sp. P06 TaxID=3366949 RepID=UPI00374694A2